MSPGERSDDDSYLSLQSYVREQVETDPDILFINSAAEVSNILTIVLQIGDTDSSGASQNVYKNMLQALTGVTASEYVHELGLIYHYTPIFAENSRQVLGVIGGGYRIGTLFDSHKELMERNSRVFFFISIPFFFLLGAGVAEWVTGPVRQLTESARLISEGDYSRAIPVSRKDEVGILAQTLRDMQDKLKSFNSEMELKIKERTASLKAILREAVAAREKNKLAQELHDSLGQFFASLNIKLSLCLRLFEKEPEKVIEHIREMREITSQGTDLTRHIISNLSDGPEEDREIRSVLNNFLRNFTEGTDISYNLNVTVNNPIDIKYRTAIYHIITEAASNMGKHSGADKFTVDLVSTEKLILLKIEDNGCGFNIGKILAVAEEKRQYGLLSIKNRVEELGGEFIIEPGKKNGTVIKISFNLQDERQ